MAAPLTRDRPQGGADLSDAAAFLQNFGNDHFLCSLDPYAETDEQKKPHCKRGNTEAVVAWAHAENKAGRNVYYHFNVVRAGLCGKASSKDITHIRGVPDDLDWGWKHHGGRYPARLHDLIEQQQRLYSTSTPPTLTVFTGGGFQNLYLFPSPLEPTPEVRRRVEALSRSFVADRGSDFVGNSDRLLRLPGFINYPNKNKAQAGQPEKTATLVFASGRTYSLEELERAFMPSAANSAWHSLGPPPAWLKDLLGDNTNELAAGIELPPPDLESITSAARNLPSAGKYRTFVDHQPELRAYDLVERDDWLKCAVFPAAHAIVEHPEHEAMIRDLFHEVSAKGVSGPYDHGSGVGRENEKKLDDEIAHIRRTGPRPDRPSIYRWVSMAEESGCANWGSSGKSKHDAPQLGTGSQVAGHHRSGPINAAPFVWADPAGLPRRKGIYDRHYIRRYVSATIARGGVGKSALGIVEALAITTGRDLLGVRPSERTNVWLWNGEDPIDELQRRVIGAALHHGLARTDIEGRLFVNSGRDTPIIIATETRDGTVINAPVVNEVVRTITEREIGLVVVDPFVSSHRVSENDNNKIDAVVKTWARVAEETGCAVELVHHSRKTNGADATVEDARGASALNAAARSVRVLNPMTPDDARKLAIQNPRQYVRIENGKANLAPPSDKAKWFHLMSVGLGNGTPTAPADEVGVAVAWAWPDALAGIDDAALRSVKQAFAGRPWRKDAQARDWAGHPVAAGLGLNLQDPTHKAKVKSLIKSWLTNGMLTEISGKGGKGKTCPFVQVGTWPV